MFGRATGIFVSAALFTQLSMGAVMAAPAQSSSVAHAGAQASATQVQAAAKRRPAVTITPLGSSTARINVQPLLAGSATWKFSLQKGKTVTKTVTKNKRRYKVSVIKWSTVLRTKTASPTQTKVLAFKQGIYRIYVPAQNKYALGVSSTFAVPMAMPTPTVTPTPKPTTPPVIPTATPTGPTPTLTSPTSPTPTSPTPSDTTATPSTPTSSGGTGSSGAGGGTTPPGGGAKVPTPPQSLAAVAGDGVITVYWYMPFFDGGSPITGYTAYAGGQRCTASASANSCVIENLVNGTAYRVTAVARNSVGDSEPAAISATVIPATVPGAPTAVNAMLQREDSSVVVSWSAGGTGGSPITKYRVEADPGRSYCESTATSCTFTGLALGTAYRFTVFARNERGESAGSAPSGEVVPAAPPGAPYNLAVVKGAASAQVSWNVAAHGSAVVKSVVVATPTTGSPMSRTVIGNPAPTSVRFTGLTNGMTYTFKVTSTNALGWEGPASAASSPVTPRTVPTPPASLLAIAASGGKAQIAWSDSDNGGAPITKYEVYSSIADVLVCRTTPTGTATQAPRYCVAGLLAIGVPVKFRVKAYNVEGGSDWSTWTQTVTPF